MKEELLKRASFGIEILANEIKSWAKEQNIEDKRLKVFLPSGTGTTALYLQKFYLLKFLLALV